MTHRSVEVPVVARVEGEGALHVRVEDDVITRLELEIYEPPRFFEAFLEGRHFSEVPDIVPRICGICPVAYQMSAIHGLERLFEVQVSPGTHELRRMLFLADLPGNSSTTPMTYWSAKSGRQFVVIASDAAPSGKGVNGAITAYALPRR